MKNTDTIDVACITQHNANIRPTSASTDCIVVLSTAPNAQKYAEFYGKIRISEITEI